MDRLLLLPPHSREEATVSGDAGLDEICCSTDGCTWIQGKGGGGFEGSGAWVGGDAGNGGARKEEQ